MSEAGGPRPYDPHDIAEQVAQHAYFRHVVAEQRFTDRDGEKYGPDLEIGTKDDLARHVEETLLDPATEALHGVDGRDIYYNEATNTVVIVNIERLDRSTCYRDSSFEGEFDRIVDAENKERDKRGLE